MDFFHSNELGAFAYCFDAIEVRNSVGIIGGISVFIQAVGTQINMSGRASMHDSCAICLTRILQDIRQAESSDRNGHSLFDKGKGNTVLNVTEREVKMLEKVENDYHTTIESCRCLVPSSISNAFSKLEVEFILMVSPVSFARNLPVDDDTCCMLLDYCFEELAIVLCESTFFLPCPDMDAVKDRLRSDAARNLAECFPYSKSVKEFQETNEELNPSPQDRRGNWFK